MTGKEFEPYLAKMAIEVKKTISKRLPDKMGNKAVSLFKKNFRDEGFFGKRWIKSKKRSGKTLTKTGDLGRSIDYEVRSSAGGGTAIVTSDLPYSRVHNEGGIIDVKPHKRTSDKGKRYNVRGYAYRAIKRQFMGDSPVLQEELKKVIEKEMKSVISN